MSISILYDMSTLDTTYNSKYVVLASRYDLRLGHSPGQYVDTTERYRLALSRVDSKGGSVCTV